MPSEPELPCRARRTWLALRTGRTCRTKKAGGPGWPRLSRCALRTRLSRLSRGPRHPLDARDAQLTRWSRIPANAATEPEQILKIGVVERMKV